MQRNPLNPALLRRLRSHFGAKEVGIIDRAVEITWELRHDEVLGRSVRDVLVHGETYTVACPFCGDTRRQLLISHRWGAWDQEAQSHNLHMATCHHQNCLAREDRQRDLGAMLFKKMGSQKLVKIRPSAFPMIDLPEVNLPGFRRLDQIAHEDPGHLSVREARSLGFDPIELGERYGVGCCTSDTGRPSTEWLKVTVRDGGRLVGWQDLELGADRNRNFRGAFPRRHVEPGKLRRYVAYNFDMAVTHPTIVIVESPADVWAVGPQAMALFGRTMSPQLVRKLALAVHRRKASIVILLDPKNPPYTRTIHPMFVLEEVLRRVPAFQGQVVLVILPDCPSRMAGQRSLIQKRVLEKAEEKGIRVSFPA
jgi:hypothetical protein